MKKRMNKIPYNVRLKSFMLNGFNYLFTAGVIIAFLFGSWVGSIFIFIILSVALYLSYKNARYYLFHINEVENTGSIEIFLLDKNTEKILKIDKEKIKVDLIDDGYDNHLRIYNRSKLILKQYPVGYWTRERLSKFYENYCKGKIEVPM